MYARNDGVKSQLRQWKAGAAAGAERHMAGLEAAWQDLLALSAGRRAGDAGGPPMCRIGDAMIRIEGETWSAAAPLAPPLAAFFDLYMPFVLARCGFAVAHLGQSLDGRIATEGGASHWITGSADLLHCHRMRALADAVVVGAATLRLDDPQLTVRDCAGDHPVRVILDGGRRLQEGYRVFQDGAAPTLLLTTRNKAAAGERLGRAEIVPGPGGAEGLAPAAIRAELARRGLRRLYIEGGGVTISRFLQAGCLDRLQLAVSPLILGSGRPGITLPEVTDLRAGLRPRIRRFELGEDVLYECVFHE